MTDIDDRLNTAAAALHDGFSNSEGPGATGIEAKSRQRHQRRAGAGLVAAAGLVAFGWSLRAPGPGEVEVAADDSIMVSDDEIESCRGLLDLIDRNEMRSSVLTDFGIDLATINPARLDVVIGVRSSTSTAGIIGLQGQGIFIGCTTDANTSGLSGGMDFPDPTQSPEPTQVWALDVRGNEGTAEIGPTFSVVGEAGRDVVSVDAGLANGVIVPGRVSDGWFAIEGPAVDAESIGEFDLVWTLVDGSTRRSPVSELPAPRLSAESAPPQEGQTFETIEGTTTRGESISVAADGTPTVLIYGASWCPPCEAFVEQAKPLVDGLDPTVRVFVVAVNDDPGRWTASVELGRDELQLETNIGEVTEVPAIIVFDGTNTITTYARGFDNLEDVFTQIGQLTD